MLRWIENKVLDMDPISIRNYHNRNRHLFLISECILVILSIYLVITDREWIGYLSLCSIFILILLFQKYAFSLGKGIRRQFTDQLMPLRAIESVNYLNDKSVLSKINQAYMYIFNGKFDLAKTTIDSIDKNRLKLSNPDEVAMRLMITESYLTIFYAERVDLSKLKNAIDHMSVKRQNQRIIESEFQRIKAIADIESGKPNSFFDSATCQHKLDELIATYYQARHNLLIGNKEKAFALFEQVSESNDEIYFVREAKRYLVE